MKGIITTAVWYCVAEELAELRTAVLGVREALSDLRANAEPSKASVLKLNVRDARDSLRRRVNQISPETSAIQVLIFEVWSDRSQTVCASSFVSSLLSRMCLASSHASDYPCSSGTWHWALACTCSCSCPPRCVLSTHTRPWAGCTKQHYQHIQREYHLGHVHLGYCCLSGCACLSMRPHMPAF